MLACVSAAFHTIAATFLGTIQGSVRPGDHRIRRFSVLQLSNPYRTGLPSDRSKTEIFHHLPHVLSRCCGAHKSGIWTDDHEFLAAPTPENISLAQPLSKNSRNRGEHHIADLMTEFIIDRLEPVDVYVATTPIGMRWRSSGAHPTAGQGSGARRWVVACQYRLGVVQISAAVANQRRVPAARPRTSRRYAS